MWFLEEGQLIKIQDYEKNNNNNCVDGYYKCGKEDHFIKYYPLWELKWRKNNYDKGKEQKKYRVPG